MDDWSHLPAGTQSANRPPKHRSRLNNHPQPPLPDSASRVKRQPQAPLNPARHQALDPTGLARQQGNEVRGKAPKPLYPPTDPTMTTANPQPTSKTANPPLDITRPFMDDKRSAISAAAGTGS
jgi:hypothetical protein